MFFFQVLLSIVFLHFLFCIHTLIHAYSFLNIFECFFGFKHGNIRRKPEKSNKMNKMLINWSYSYRRLNEGTKRTFRMS